MKKAEIWIVGGGKGGTGKTLVSSVIGASLSKNGKKVILIDGDIGGSNLHTFLGIRNPEFSLSDFFEKKKPLKSLVLKTEIKGLNLIAGDIKTINPMSFKYIQRLKLYRDIKKLEADIIIIDLGAGTVLNTLDTFLLADNMILVTTPEITSIENLYLFLKKVIIRKVNDILYEKGFNNLVKDWMKNGRDSENKQKFKDFMNFIDTLEPGLKKTVKENLHKFRVNLIINQVRDEEHLNTGILLKNVLRRHFEIDVLFSGFILIENALSEMINSNSPVKNISEKILLMNKFENITRNISSGKDISFEELKNEK
ncbi:MAG: P-loop NTPase [Acidobacteriota bacterium]